MGEVHKAFLYMQYRIFLSTCVIQLQADLTVFFNGMSFLLERMTDKAPYISYLLLNNNNTTNLEA